TVKEFTDRYTAKYSAPPSYHSAGGYAAGQVLQKALEDAGSTDPEKVRAALDRMDLMLFYGHVKFSTDTKTHGKQTAHDMVYVQWAESVSRAPLRARDRTRLRRGRLLRRGAARHQRARAHHPARHLLGEPHDHRARHGHLDHEPARGQREPRLGERGPGHDPR